MTTLRRRLLAALLALAAGPLAVAGVAALAGGIRLSESRLRSELAHLLDAFLSTLAGEIGSERILLQQVVHRRGADPIASLLDDPELARRLVADRPVAARFLLTSGPGAPWRGVERARGGIGRPRRVTRPAEAAPLPPPVATSLRPEGAVLRLAHALPGERHALVEEIPIVPLAERVLAAPVFSRLAGAYLLFDGGPGTQPVVLYHTDLRWIGLGAPPSAMPAAGARRFERRGGLLWASGTEATTGWIAGAALPLGPARAALRRGLLLYAGTVALLLALTSLGILRVTRGVGEAVEEIAATSSAVARGDFERRAHVSRRDEFALIAEQVNRMSEELKLTSASRAIASASAGLLHDVHGVVQELRLLLHNLRENIYDAEFRAECLDLMEALIRDVEALGERLKAGDTGGPSRPFDLDALVARILSGAPVAAQPHLAVEHRRGAGPAVIADPALVADALRNLLRNAVSATRAAGRITVRTGTTGRSAPSHFVEVEDDGPGMTPEFIEHELFRPFATSKRDGLGLGMYEVRRNIERSGGRVAVRSSPGEGTVVRLEFGGPPGEAT